MNIEHKKEPLQNYEVHDNGYDHLNMHHHPGNAKEIEELSLPETLIDIKKAIRSEPSKTIFEKVYSSTAGNNDDVC